MNESKKQPKRLFEVEIVETVRRRVFVLARDEAEAARLNEEQKILLSRCGSFIESSVELAGCQHAANPKHATTAYDVERGEWVGLHEEE